MIKTYSRVEGPADCLELQDRQLAEVDHHEEEQHRVPVLLLVVALLGLLLWLLLVLGHLDWMLLVAFQ